MQNTTGGLTPNLRERAVCNKGLTESMMRPSSFFIWRMLVSNSLASLPEKAFAEMPLNFL